MRKIENHTAKILLIFFLLFTLYACSKKDDGGSQPIPATEDKLDVKLSAASIETSPSSSFPFAVNILSKLPVGGVTIKIDVKREDNAASVYNIQANANVASNNFTISPLPPGQIYCVAVVTVTSVTTPANIWTGSFRVLWK